MENRKLNTVFIDLKGKLANYLGKVYTNHTTNDVAVQTLKTKLNIIINDIKEKGLPATAENCEEAWKSIVAAVYDSQIENREDTCYKEIIDIVNNIGMTIAYLCKRRGGGWVNQEIGLYPEYTDYEKLKAFKILLLNKINEGKITRENQRYEYSYMTDEELLDLCNEYMDKVRESRAAQYGFKVSDIESEFSGKSRAELIAEAGKLYQMIDMIKRDRIPVLTGTNEEYKRRLTNYVNSGKADIWETLDVEELQRTLTQTIVRYNKISTYLQAV